MNAILFLILRRMRPPLLVLSAVYSLAVLGMVLMPGMDDQGNPWRMDFFHALYFVTFMGTTIGFGELPYPFTGAQRLWATICSYMTVIAWVYAIGALLALLRHDALQRAFTERRFGRAVRNLREPFYLICGYGETGRSLVSALQRRFMRSVVIDSDQERTNDLALEDYLLHVPALCGDAGLPGNLLQAGINHPKCAGVVALTDQNQVNLHIAISAKLLNPAVKVICRADSHAIEANMASFGTDHIIDPFDTFAEHLATALASPSQYLLIDWLSSQSDAPLEEPWFPPRGLWIVCAYGRFGKAVCCRLEKHHIPFVVIEPDPANAEPPEGTVVGPPTQAETLKQARVHEAVGIVAGTADDSDNLSITMTAKRLNPKLFVVARRNQHINRPIFNCAHANVVMAPGRVVANTIRGLLTVPLVYDFLQCAIRQKDEWASTLISRLAALVPGTAPEIWETEIGERESYAVEQALGHCEPVGLGHLMTDPSDRDVRLCCIPLLLARDEKKMLLPDDNLRVQSGDRFLFAGATAAQSRMGWTLENDASLSYVMTGESAPRTPLGRWLTGMLNG